MTPATIIRNALTDGVIISLSAAGKIKAVGNGIAVNRWLPLIRENKASITTVLLAANDPAPTRLLDADATAIRAWLASIGETDPVIRETLDKCADDPDALAYYMGRATEDLQEPEAYATSCDTCQHFARPDLSDGHCGGRDDLPLAYGINHPLRKLPSDYGASCQLWALR